MPKLTKISLPGLPINASQTWLVLCWFGCLLLALPHIAYASVSPTEPANAVQTRLAQTLLAPTNLVATQVLGGIDIQLVWQDNSANEDLFRIYRCQGSGCTNFVEIVSTMANENRYMESALSFATVYRYHVRAFRIDLEAGEFESEPSNIAEVTTAGPPVAPTNLTAQLAPNGGGYQIDLTWTDNATDEDGFYLYYCGYANCTPLSRLPVVLPANSTSYQVNSLTFAANYRYHITAYNLIGESAPSNIVDVRTAGALPAVPSNLVAQPDAVRGEAQINLTWSDNSWDENGFMVARCQGEDCALNRGEIIADLSIDVTSYQDTGLSRATTYRYIVTAYNGAGFAHSNIATGRTAGDLPATPTNLTLESHSTRGNLALWLTWIDNATDEDSYQIYRCAGADCTDFVEIGSSPANNTSYLDPFLAPATTYRYQVRAKRMDLLSAPSNIATFTTLAPPTAPTMLAAEINLATGNAITLTWVDNASNEAGFTIYRCQLADCTNFVETWTTLADAVQYQPAAEAVGTVYRFYVQAFNDAGDSAPSNIATVTTFSPPAAPSNLTAQPDALLGSSQINLSWSDNAPDERHFRLLRCQGAACTNFAVLAATDANVTTYQDQNLSPATTYRYRVLAYNLIGDSAPTAIVNATTVDVPPRAPTDLVLETLSGSQISLRWTDNANNETNFRILRCQGDNCTGFAGIATVAANRSNYLDNQLTPDTTYRYQVVALNGVGNSAPTHPVTATTGPQAPTDLQAAEISPTQVRLTWVDRASNEQGFRIFRCVGRNCQNFAMLDSTAADSLTYVDTTLTTGTIYRYQVAAYKEVGYSEFSNPLQITAEAEPIAPDNLVLELQNIRHFGISWRDNANNETSFRILRCIGTHCTNFAQIGRVAANTTYFLDQFLATTTSYRYKVRAYNSNGRYSDSLPVVAITGGPPPVPTNLVATPLSPVAIRLTWSGNTNIPLTFRIHRCAGADCTNFQWIGSVAPTNFAATYTYVDLPLTQTTVYRYMIKAYRDGVLSADSAIVSATTPVLEAPGSLELTAVSPVQIDLRWRHPDQMAENFQISRCEGADCNNFTVLTSVAGTSRNYSDRNLAPDTTYRYQVQAIAHTSTSTPSRATSATPPLPVPTGFTAQAESGTQILLRWDTIIGAMTYEIYRCEGAECTDFVQLATISARSSSYRNVGLTINTTYRYRVRAVNGVKGSNFSMSLTTASGPIAPTDLTARAVTNDQIDLTWRDNASNESGFRIYRCQGENCTNFEQVATTPADAVSYQDRPLVFGAIYRYRITAYTASGNSNLSTTVAALVDATPVTPTDLQAQSVSDVQINLLWRDNASNEDGFRIYRCLGAACTNFTVIDMVAANTRSYRNLGLAPDLVYRYRVQAFNNVDSALSPIATATTGPGAPSSLRAVALSSNRIQLRWVDHAVSESGYQIYNCLGSSCSPLTLVGIVDANTVVFEDTAVAAGVSYRYRVRAYNANGTSRYSTISTTLTPPAASGVSEQAATENALPVQGAAVSLDAATDELTLQTTMGSHLVVTQSVVCAVGSAPEQVTFWLGAAPFVMAATDTVHQYTAALTVSEEFAGPQLFFLRLRWQCTADETPIQSYLGLLQVDEAATDSAVRPALYLPIQFR